MVGWLVGGGVAAMEPSRANAQAHDGPVRAGSCGISRPFGDEKVLHRYLEDNAMTRLRRRLEADAKSLFALYQYGRLHRAVRLRWGFLDERFPVSWAHRDEPWLYALKQLAPSRAAP